MAKFGKQKMRTW